MSPDPKFELPKKIEQHLAVLSKLYGHEGLKQKQELLVNAQVRVHEQWSYDNWNGGIYGHALYLTLPEGIYLKVIKDKDTLESEIKADINKIDNYPDEFIDVVFLEMAPQVEGDWRRESGLLSSPRRVVARDAGLRIWRNDGYRIFLSHKAEVKKEAAQLKKELELFGASCFVAHEDILPTKVWQSEIESALASMDAFIALMTPTFHDSEWTDQEVGFALARDVPIIAVKLGTDPYGFIGKFQALSTDWAGCSSGIIKLLIKHPRMLDAYVASLPSCRSFGEGNKLSEALPCIERLTLKQADEMMSAFNNSFEIRGSFGFNGSWPDTFGPGLASHLSRASGVRYEVKLSGKIGRKTE